MDFQRQFSCFSQYQKFNPAFIPDITSELSNTTEYILCITANNGMLQLSTMTWLCRRKSPAILLDWPNELGKARIKC